MLENCLPARDHTSSSSKSDTLSGPLTDDDHNDHYTPNRLNHSSSYLSPLIPESATVSESDMSLLNTLTSVTNADSVALLGTHSKDVPCVDQISELLQAEL